MTEGSNVNQDRQQPPRSGEFISGWFTAQFEAGKQPKYGYPQNHLPATGDATMHVVTGFIASKGK